MLHFFVNKMLMLAAMTLPNKNSKPLSVIISTLHFLDLHNGSGKCIAIDQHCYMLNPLQRYNPNSFPECETPFPPDFTFSKDNCPVTDHDKRIIDKQHQPFRSTVCMLLYLAYNTQANINSAFCKLAKACIYPRNFNFCALTIWLLGFLQQRPAYNAAKFYADANSNPVYHVCHQHCIPHTNFTISSDASWQDCPDTGLSSIRCMIFHNAILIKANSTMPTPIAMPNSEAKYMVACSTSMAIPHHICMLLYNMTYLGTQQWHESTQCLPTIASILMKDNEAIVQIACTNGKLPCKKCHIKQPFCHVRQDRQDGIHQLHWNLVHHNLLTSTKQKQTTQAKTQVPSKTDLHINKIICTLPNHMLQSTNTSIEI
jgi:hypothetical protein